MTLNRLSALLNIDLDYLKVCYRRSKATKVHELCLWIADRSEIYQKNVTNFFLDNDASDNTIEYKTQQESKPTFKEIKDIVLSEDDKKQLNIYVEGGLLGFVAGRLCYQNTIMGRFWELPEFVKYLCNVHGPKYKYFYYYIIEQCKRERWLMLAFRYDVVDQKK
jgi:hypothetical protein